MAPFAGVTLRHVAAGLRHVVAVSGTLSTAVARANTQHGLPLLTRLVLLVLLGLVCSAGACVLLGMRQRPPARYVHL